MVGTHEPCRLIPGRALEGHSQSPAWAWLNLAATRPRDPYLLFNHRDTRLIPGDTPMTEKRRPSLLPRVPSRHITDLRHTLSFGSRRGYEAPVNSYLTGASPIFLGLRSRTGRWRPPRSSRARNPRSSSDLTAGLEVCFAHHSCTRRRRPSDARATGAHGSRNGR